MEKKKQVHEHKCLFAYLRNIHNVFVKYIPDTVKMFILYYKNLEYK